jgi:hypothetical protein
VGADSRASKIVDSIVVSEAQLRSRAKSPDSPVSAARPMSARLADFRWHCIAHVLEIAARMGSHPGFLPTVLPMLSPEELSLQSRREPHSRLNQPSQK